MLNFHRRINGRTYYAALALLVIFSIILVSLNVLLASVLGQNNILVGKVFVAVYILIIVFAVIYSAAIVRQRANDISGKHPLIIFALLYLTPMFIVGGLIPGEKTPNRYGGVPSKNVKLT